MSCMWSHNSAWNKWKTSTWAAHWLTIPTLVFVRKCCVTAQRVSDQLISVSCKAGDATKEWLPLFLSFSLIQEPGTAASQPMSKFGFFLCVCGSLEMWHVTLQDLDVYIMNARSINWKQKLVWEEKERLSAADLVSCECMSVCLCMCPCLQVNVGWWFNCHNVI